MSETKEAPRAPWRQRVEAGFAAWGHTVARGRWIVIVTMLAVTAGLGTQLRHVRFDTSNESLFKKHDPTRVTYDHFREQFGREDLVLIAVESDGEVFELPFLEHLRALHEAIEAEVPHVDDVTSLVNARSTRGAEGELIVEDLLEDWPETAEDLARVRRIAHDNPLYRDVLLSADGRTTTVLVRMSAFSSLQPQADALTGFESGTEDASPGPAYITGEENAEFSQAVSKVVADFDAPGFRLYHTGGPVIQTRILFDMQSNIRFFLALVLATIGSLLFALFRRLAGVLLPLGVVMLSIISTFGLQGIRGGALGIPTQIVPSFLLAVGVGAAVHILVIFFQHYDQGESAEDAVSFTLGHSGLAVVMTAFTTAGGLVSFAASEVAPVADLGVLAPIGILAGLVYCLALLPAALCALPLKRRARAPASSKTSLISRALVATGDFAVRHPGAVLAVTAALIVVAAIGALRIRFEHDTLRWFPEDDPIRTDTTWIDHSLSGSMALEVLLDTGRENGLQDPALLATLDRLSDEVRQIRGGRDLSVRKTLSIADVVKEINQALEENRPEARRVPESRELVAQELLLFENSGSDDLEDFVDSQFRTGRFTLRMPYVPPAHYHRFIPEVEDLFRRELGPDVEVRTTGFMALLAASMDAISRSMFSSYTLALIIITPLMMLLIGSLRGGLASMIPNLAPILLVLGLMGWTGIQMDLFTLLIGSIAIGLAVDDTIHFMHNFYRYFRQTGDTRGSVRRTLETTGQAMLVTSIVLSLGFFTYTFAELRNLFNFGLLTGICIVLAFIADVLVGPALVTLATRRASRARAGSPEGVPA